MRFTRVAYTQQRSDFPGRKETHEASYGGHMGARSNRNKMERALIYLERRYRLLSLSLFSSLFLICTQLARLGKTVARGGVEEGGVEGRGGEGRGAGAE